MLVSTFERFFGHTKPSLAPKFPCTLSGWGDLRSALLTGTPISIQVHHGWVNSYMVSYDSWADRSQLDAKMQKMQPVLAVAAQRHGHHHLIRYWGYKCSCSFTLSKRMLSRIWTRSTGERPVPFLLGYSCAHPRTEPGYHCLGQLSFLCLPSFNLQSPQCCKCYICL